MNMNKESFLRLQGEVKPKVSSAHALMDLGANLLMLAVFLLLLSTHEIFGYLLSQLVLGVVILRSLFLMHECAHGLQSKNKWLTSALGNFYGIFCLLPYPAWRLLHLKHHTYAGIRGMDPLLVITNTNSPILKSKVISKTLGFLWGMGFPYIELIRSMGYVLSPLIILKKHKDRKLFVRALSAVVFIVSFWTLAHKFFPEFINLKNLVPGFFIYLLLNELVSIPQHMDMPSAEASYGVFPLWEHPKVTRSVFLPQLIDRHVFLYFNLHTEHHVFPKLPWRQLQKAQSILKKDLGTNYPEANWDWSLKKRKGKFSDIIKLKDLPHD